MNENERIIVSVRTGVSDLFHLEIAEGGVKDDEQLRDIESRLDQIARECLSMTDKYKAIFNSNSTMGVAKALVNGKDVYIRWIQLWEGGPKFAEFNWKAENIKPYHDGEMWCIEDFGCFSREEWGLNWRFPTMEELGDETNHRGLIYECTCEWIQNDYGISPNAGLLCTGKGEFSGNSIFLPAMGSEASYITSTLRKRAYTGTSNYFLYISPDEAVMKIDRDIKPGLLRPVLNEGDMEPE